VPIKRDWHIVAGDEETVMIDFPGDVSAFAGWTVAAQVRAQPLDTTVLATCATIPPRAYGTGRWEIGITLSAVQTRALGDRQATVGTGSLHYDVELQPPSGGPHTIITGSVTVSQDVTR